MFHFILLDRRPGLYTEIYLFGSKGETLALLHIVHIKRPVARGLNRTPSISSLEYCRTFDIITLIPSIIQTRFKSLGG